MDYKPLMIQRIQDRKDKIISYCDKIIRLIEAGKMGGEAGRLWLEQFAVGVGLNLGCGDFSIGDSYGVDGDSRVLGMDIWAQADRYINSGPYDYVITNYLDCFPDILGTLKNWSSCSGAFFKASDLVIDPCISSSLSTFISPLM